MALRVGSRSDRPGFSVLELVAATCIGAVLTGLTVSGLADYMNRQGALNARDSFIHLAGRARAAAVERGEVVRLEVDPGADRAWFVTGSLSGGDTLDLVAYAGEFKADVVTKPRGRLTVCYTPRGYALRTCNSFDDAVGAVEVAFRRVGYSESATVQVLGHVKAN